SLDDVVASCVNFVGVDLNTASYALLRYVSGLNQLTARRVFEHRTQNGPFRSREQLKDVPGLGEAAFIQAAGFLRIADGENYLDATWLQSCRSPVAGGRRGRRGLGPWQTRRQACTGEVSPKAEGLDIACLVGELGGGELALRGVLGALVGAGRRPPEGLPP